MVPINIGIGINNGLPPFDIKDQYSSEEGNCDSRKFPAINVRAPRSMFASALEGTQYGLDVYKGTYITAVDEKAWKYWDGDSWEAIATLGASAKASQANFTFSDTVYLLLANGTDRVSWNGTTSAVITDMPANANQLAVHANRVYTASTSDDVLSWSALGTYADWTTANDSGDKQVATGDGETNNGLVEYNDHIIYFKKHSCHELFGTGPTNYSFQTLSDTIGCLAPRTIVEVQGTLFFLGKEGVYGYTGGVTPSLISWPYIGDYIKRMDITNIDSACAGTDGDRYYLCLPIDSNARILLTYDVRNASWHVEDDFNFVEFTPFNSELYGMLSPGVIIKIDGEAGEDLPTNWSWTSKRFLYNPSTKQSIGYMYAIVDLPTDSTLKVSLKSMEGAFTDVKTFTASTELQNVKIPVRISVVSEATWYQVRFSGSGPCTIHRFEKLKRARGNSYG